MTLHKTLRTIAALPIATAAWCAFAVEVGPADQTGQHYVIGSWVNVRSTPAPDATVVDHVIVNTPVAVLNSEAGKGFCEINYGDGKRGFLVCRLIADAPLTLEEVDVEYINGRDKNPKYSATRAFWIEPSVERLLAAGRHFEVTMLKPEEFAAERGPDRSVPDQRTPRRFPIPEYEAMKDLLRKGVKGVSRERHAASEGPLVRWQDLRDIASRNPFAREFDPESLEVSKMHQRWGHRSPPMTVISMLEPGSAQRSFFRSADGWVRPSATTVAASALLDVPYRAKVLHGPKWVLSDGPWLYGAWDAGAIETRLMTPVWKHSVYRSGKIVSEATDIPGGRFPPKDSEHDDCPIGFAYGDAGTNILRQVYGDLPAGRQKATERLFYFYSKTALPDGSAKVQSEKNLFISGGFASAETLKIDLDRDGVEDILVWEGTGVSQQPIHDPGSSQAHYRMVFFNIAGDWHLFVVDEFLYGCGC